MKKYLFIGSLLLASVIKAQLVNNGATIVIQTGGNVFCAGSFTNASGTVTNDGKIEVQGSFSNSGTYASTTNDDSLILSGSGSVTLNSGGSVFRYLTINKASNADLVTLNGSVFIGNKLDYGSGVLTTDYPSNPSYAVIAPASAVFNFAPAREITGNVKRTGWSNGSTVLFNGANMQLTTAGGTAPADVTVTMLPQAYGGDPTLAEREVKRKFLFTPTGGAGYTADIRFPYADAVAELDQNTEGNLVPWTLLNGEWNARLTPVTRDGANNWVSTTGIAAGSLAQEWKLADPNYTFTVTANLRGAWNGTDMHAAVNASLPTTQPYNISPFNYTGTETANPLPNANIVDWVLVDFRKPSDGLPGSATASTVIGQKAAFLLRNGTLVDLDGSTPLSLTLSKQGTGFFVIRHRNHLAVMSKSLPSNAAGTFANDFTVPANAYSNPGISNMPLQLLPGSLKYGLWAGDANRDGVINASDIGLLKAQANGSLSGYHFGDANLDATVNASDVGLAKLSANASASSHSSRTAVSTDKKSHVPSN